MILVNNSIRYYDDVEEKWMSEIEYANGDLGYLREFDKGYAKVELMRNGKLVDVPYTVKENVVPFDEADKEKTHLAERNFAAWQSGQTDGLRPNIPYTAYDPHNSPIGIVVGTCEHIPLRVAYATTCHKSQGLTLDRIQINLNTQFFGYGGMSYVGLSRARTAEGLRIVVGNENTFVKRCKVNPKVERWL